MPRKRTPEELYRDSSSEADIRATIMGEAPYLGWLVSYTPDSRKDQGDAGRPDLMLARRGRVVFVELKSARGTVRPAQKRWIDALGENVYLIRPSNLDWFLGVVLK
jgi:hypothetical protein